MAVTRTKTKTKPTRNRSLIKKTLRNALRAAFPEDTVDISDGYLDNIHVVVVSRSFDAMSEKQKQQRLWKLIDATDLSDDEKSLISLVYPVSIAELK
jgi:acid stress-induced BolA-like protein IbaG/YrbA